MITHEVRRYRVFLVHFFFSVRCVLFVIVVILSGGRTAPSGRRLVAVPWRYFWWPGTFPFFFVKSAWLQDVCCILCFQSARANGLLSMPIMWLRSLQWPVLRRTAKVRISYILSTIDIHEVFTLWILIWYN